MLSVTVSVPKYYQFTNGEEMMLKLCYEYNHKVMAIKFLREQYGYGLKESKDICDAFWEEQKNSKFPQHWSTKHIGEPNTRCYNCNPPTQQELNKNKSNSLGELLKSVVNELKVVETQGYKAQAAGKDLVKDNPYSENGNKDNADKHWAWRSGYLDAVRDSRG